MDGLYNETTMAIINFSRINTIYWFRLLKHIFKDIKNYSFHTSHHFCNAIKIWVYIYIYNIHTLHITMKVRRYLWLIPTTIPISNLNILYLYSPIKHIINCLLIFIHKREMHFNNRYNVFFCISRTYIGLIFKTIGQWHLCKVS